MGEVGDLMRNFTRCFRRANQLSGLIEKPFFRDLWCNACSELLSGFTDLLRKRGEMFSFKMPIGADLHVAQCKTMLIFKIEELLKLTSIAKHLKFYNGASPLFLERDLLLLKLAVLDLNLMKNRPEIAGLVNLGRGKRRSKKILASKKSSIATAKKPKAVKITRQETEATIFTEPKRQLLGFIESQKGPVRNTAIFAEFKKTKRTLKRHLGDLVKSGDLKRFSNGKKVFYQKLVRKSYLGVELPSEDAGKKR